MPVNIRLRQLRAFKAIVENASVSEAAVALGLTQSSVSKMLAGFEAELGFALFDRVGRRLHLTEQGRQFFHRTEDAMELLDSIRTAAEDIRDNVAARFRVTAIGPLSLSGFLPRILRQFGAEYPEFRFSVETKVRAEIEDWIVGQHADVGLTLLPVRRGQLSSRTFASVQAVAILPKGHPLAGQNCLSPAAIADADIIMPRPAVRLRNLVEASFVQAGVELRPRFETSNAVSTASLVAAGNGIAVIDPFTVTGAPPGKIHVVPWEPTTILNYGTIWSGSRALAAHERRLHEVAENVAQDLARSQRHFVLA